MKIIRQKHLYLYIQEKALPPQDKYNTWDKDYMFRTIVTEKKLKEKNMYEDVAREGISWGEYFQKVWYPLIDEDQLKGMTHEIQYTTKSQGWRGIYQLLPNSGSRNCVEFIITAEYDSEDCDGSSKNNPKKLMDMPDAEFTSKHGFFVMNNYSEIMLGWGSEPFWEVDDGYIKWDVGDRNNATLITDGPFKGLFEGCMEGSHGEAIPYYAEIKVQAKIHTNFNF